jgi:hypothetical protein
VNLLLKYGNIFAYWSARSIKGAMTAMFLTNSSERENRCFNPDSAGAIAIRQYFSTIGLRSKVQHWSDI